MFFNACFSLYAFDCLTLVQWLIERTVGGDSPKGAAIALAGLPNTRQLPSPAFPRANLAPQYLV